MNKKKESGTILFQKKEKKQGNLRKEQRKKALTSPNTLPRPFNRDIPPTSQITHSILQLKSFQRRHGDTRKCPQARTDVGRGDGEGGGRFVRRLGLERNMESLLDLRLYVIAGGRHRADSWRLDDECLLI